MEIFVRFFLGQPPAEVIIQLIGLGGWTIFAWLLLYAGLFLLAFYKRVKYTAKWNWILLAIDIPSLNLQTPKAVEQLFSHIYSVMEPPSIGFVYRRGFRQEYFSFEIISIEGYIQFLIRVREKYRDVVEAAIYAQYPEAEITEVEDYVNEIPSTYPNETHNIFAADYVLTEHWAYPIRVYQEFEHNISKDTILKDPMGTFLESFSRIGPGEQVWFQMIIEPIQEKRWKNEAIKKIKEMVGDKTLDKGGSKVAHAVSTLSMRAIEGLGDQIFGREPSPTEEQKKKDQPLTQMLFLTPGQKKLVEAMEDKISKLGFRTKVRVIYSARKEVYKPSRAMNSITGAINQYSIPSSNALLPKYLTATQYLFAQQRKDYRRRLLMSAYKKRENEMGKEPFILNIEELATIWHFPMSHVKTPLLQKATLKTAEPPSGLPIEFVGEAGLPAGIAGEQPLSERAGEQGGERPQKTYQTDSGDVGYADTVEFG